MVTGGDTGNARTGRDDCMIMRNQLQYLVDANRRGPEAGAAPNETDADG